MAPCIGCECEILCAGRLVDTFPQIFLFWKSDLLALYAIIPVCRCSDAVLKFLAEAVTLLARKPHEFYELQQATQMATAGLGGKKGQYSLLPVAALRQAVRVSGSAKIPASTRAAIAGYVSGGPCSHRDS
jgi:hypothetical protein